MQNPLFFVFLAAVGVVLLVFFLVFARYFRLWLRAFLAGAQVPLVSLMTMTLSRVDPEAIVDARIMLVQARLPDVPLSELIRHAHLGGDVRRVARTLIAAQREGLETTWEEAAALDLADESSDLRGDA